MLIADICLNFCGEQLLYISDYYPHLGLYIYNVSNVVSFDFLHDFVVMFKEF